MLSQAVSPVNRAPRNGGWDVISRYFAVDPRTINPFNQSHHNHVPSGDPVADAEYLALVASGDAERFFITLVELVNAAGRYEVVCYDGFNGNTVFSHPAQPVERSAVRLYGTNDERLLIALDGAIDAAVQHGIAFMPELAVVHSRVGREHLALLEAYADGQHDDEMVHAKAEVR